MHNNAPSTDKADLVAVFTHQLRTSLSALKWVLRMLADPETGTLSPAQAGLVAEARESTERMVALTSDLLSLSRVESDSVPLKVERAPLAPIIERAIAMFRAQAAQKRIALSFDNQAAGEPQVRCDPVMLAMALENVISNAMNYTPDGGSVTVSLSADDGAARVSVADTGIGIAPKDRESLFQKFFRADNAREAHPGGSGLGLYIARSIVERHGGALGFETPAHGAVFSFTLPLD